MELEIIPADAARRLIAQAVPEMYDEEDGDEADYDRSELPRPRWQPIETPPDALELQGM